MKNQIAIIVFLILLMDLTLLSIKKCEAKPVFRATFAQGLTISFPKGEATPKPLSSQFGFGIANTVNDWLGWYTEPGLSTPNSVFHPSPRLFTGPTFRWSCFISQPAILYQYTPSYAGKKSSQLIAGSLMVGVKASEELNITLAVGVGQTLETSEWSLSFVPKLSFKLPF